MRWIAVALLAALTTQMVGCLGTAKVLSAIGKSQQNQRSYTTQPNYYPNYTAPAVNQPQLHNTGVQHCRTIGYITTCQ